MRQFPGIATLPRYARRSPEPKADRADLRRVLDRRRERRRSSRSGLLELQPSEPLPGFASTAQRISLLNIRGLLRASPSTGIPTGCLLVAQTGHDNRRDPRQLSRVKQPRLWRDRVAASDPKRTSSAPNRSAVEAGFSPYKNVPSSRYDALS